ncbi:uncharacterized protein B0H18DRAFT_1125662 [Fomitopsis serialis]|uniref:uncharacterized protein n=1 Tax=Fomitopsis serialis TaxID=139415 RepID=UPI002007E993|nr:uncharacterized protein B0H18DRAFT_1125662 [Neoantrodia serialis]KAH9914324.1 hypothetical protein B0H18DRAFT_1125662 [Neoantrodia serialis]
MSADSLDIRAANYMIALYEYRLAYLAGTAGQNLSPAPDADFSVEMIGQAHQMVEIIKEAFLRRIFVNWNAEDYAEAIPAEISDRTMPRLHRAMKEFPPLELGDGIFTQPATVVDALGHVLLWYLPGIITAEQQASVIPSLLMASTTWRNHPDNFAATGQWQSLDPGCISFSPGWYQQGHQGTTYPPQVSSTLSEEQSPGRDWFRAMTEQHALIAGMLRIIHPELHAMGYAALASTRICPDIADVLPLWGTPFNAMSVITNRRSPLHLDRMSAKDWYDLLITIGGDNDTVLELPTLGLTLQYAGGERLCVVYYLRPQVHKWAKVKKTSWLTVDF